MVFLVFCIVSNLSEKVACPFSISSGLILDCNTVKRVFGPEQDSSFDGTNYAQKRIAMNQRCGARVVIRGARFIIFV